MDKVFIVCFLSAFVYSNAFADFNEINSFSARKHAVLTNTVYTTSPVPRLKDIFGLYKCSVTQKVMYYFYINTACEAEYDFVRANYSIIYASEVLQSRNVSRPYSDENLIKLYELATEIYNSDYEF